MRNSLDTSDIPKEDEKLLTEEQETAVRQIMEEWEKPFPRPVLIEGVTGSGKTQVYMKLIEWTVSRGEQAIVLIPEIALTYQTVRRFYARFGDKVSVINSRQSQGERYDQFRRAKRGEVQVMIGPRSALFTPFSNLGLIVIDEEHEPSYKSENSPRYHARETAVQRSILEHAKIVMGSSLQSGNAGELWSGQIECKIWKQAHAAGFGCRSERGIKSRKSFCSESGIKRKDEDQI